jgi:hypothetical protein
MIPIPAVSSSWPLLIDQASGDSSKERIVEHLAVAVHQPALGAVLAAAVKEHSLRHGGLGSCTRAVATREAQLLPAETG